jgi:hypothetical protein
MNDLSDWTISNTTGDHWIVEDADGIHREIPKGLAKDEGRLRAMLKFWLPIEQRAYEEGRRDGIRRGRADICATVQELLGIEQLSDAAAGIAQAVDTVARVLESRHYE